MGSSVRMNRFDTIFAIEFNDCIRDLIYSQEVQKLQEFSQHFNTSRYQHSLNVAYHSYFLCKIFHFDYRSAARAGLLHDLFFYDWREEKQPEGNHAFAHAAVALRNAGYLTELNQIEADAIINHMWPLAKSMPKHRESYVVSLADKLCTIFEITEAFKNFFVNKYKGKQGQN